MREGDSGRVVVIFSLSRQWRSQMLTVPGLARFPTLATLAATLAAGRTLDWSVRSLLWTTDRQCLPLPHYGNSDILTFQTETWRWDSPLVSRRIPQSEESECRRWWPGSLLTPPASRLSASLLSASSSLVACGLLCNVRLFYCLQTNPMNAFHIHYRLVWARNCSMQNCLITRSVCCSVLIRLTNLA